jgi:hypothetical membrane protein
MKLLAWCGIIAPLLRLSLISLLGALDPDYSQLRNYISELGAEGAPFAFTMNVFGISLVGVLLIAFSAALYQAARPGFFAAVGTALLAASGLAFGAVGFFPCDPGCSLAAPSETMRVHLIAGTIAMATQTLAPIAFGMHFVIKAGAKPYAVASLAFGGVALIAVVLLFGFGSSLTWHGLPQKTFQVATDLWVLMSATLILRYPR